MTYDFTKEPSELVEYLKGKGLKLTFNYEEMMHEAHHKAFTVAKVTKLDLLSDIHTSLQNALKEGKPFSQWKDELKPTLKEKGWWGEVEVTKGDGSGTLVPPETKTIYVGSRRLKTIYDTNMRVAYATGRYESQMQSDAEYLYYSAVLDQLTRPDHSKMHGTILPKTHPWWNKNYPPNGWHCRCKARAFTKEELQSQGLKPSNFTPPNIADKDWAYHVGKTDRAEEIYKEKVEALKCKSKNAKGKEVDCGFLEEVKEAFKEDVKAIAQNAALFKAVQELFVEPNKKVELCKSDVFGKEKRVLLSSDTVQSHAHREEITAFEYSLIPSMLEGDKKVFIQDDTRYIILKKLGKLYRLTLKDIEDADEIFAVSLFHAGSDEEKAIKRIIDGIKNKK